MIIDLETNLVYVSALLKVKHPTLYDAISKILEDEEIELRELLHTNDIWCRDYMPIQISEDEFIQFNYDPDYLKPKKYINLKTDPFKVLEPLLISPILSALIVDGGNIVRHKNKVIMTNKVLLENKIISKEDMLKLLQIILNVEEIIIVPKVPHDYTGHSDGMVRFINHHTVLLNDFSRYHTTYFEELKKSLTKHNLNITLLPWNGWKNNLDGDDTGDYINFLHVGNCIIMPEYNNPSDVLAKKVIQQSYPEAKVISVDARKIAQDGGVLNCCTWNIKKI